MYRHVNTIILEIPPWLNIAEGILAVQRNK